MRPTCRAVRSATLALAVALGAVSVAAHPADGEPGVHVVRWPPPARLGIALQPMTEELRRYFEAPPDRGVLVVRVDPEGPASEAGVRVADVIVAVGERPVEAPHDVMLAVAGAPSGEPLLLELVRERKPRTIEVVPRGDPVPWLDAERWDELREQMQRGLRRGRYELERRLRELERRLEELERRLEAPLSPGEERT